VIDITPVDSGVPDTRATAMPAVSFEIPFSAPPHLCEVLEAIGAESTANPGSFLFHRGDHCQGVFVIKSGRVRLSMETHRSASERMAGPGSILGLPATMSGKHYSLTAEAVETSRYVFVDGYKVRDTLARNPELCFEVLGLLSREVQQLRERL
jgi:CRP/FNR family transcriptional regulator